MIFLYSRYKQLNVTMLNVIYSLIIYAFFLDLNDKSVGVILKSNLKIIYVVYAYYTRLNKSNHIYFPEKVMILMTF